MMHSAHANEDDSKLMFELYRKHQSHAEVMVPYRITDGKGGNPFTVMFCTKTYGSLWNMDSPWIMSVVFALSFNILMAVGVWIASHFMSGIVERTLLTALIIVAAIIVMFMMPAIYAVVVGTNLFLGYGWDWWRIMLGPTHIGVTDSGFKMYYRGLLFYNYPDLSLWDDVTSVDLEPDARDTSLAALRIGYRNGHHPKSMQLPLQGFGNAENAKHVLRMFLRYVPESAQSSRFIAMSKLDFEPAIALLGFTPIPQIEKKES